MSSRQDVFRSACEAVAFAEDSEDPAQDLQAVGYALMLIGRDLAGRSPTEQRALLMAAQLHVDEQRVERARAQLDLSQLGKRRRS